MKTITGKFFCLLVVLAMMTVVSSCQKKKPTAPGFGPESPGYGAGGPSGPGGMGDFSGSPLTEAERRELMEKLAAFENQDVYFDYDSYALSAPAKKVLDEKAAFVKKFASKVKITVEGHCDERGTTEYNIALGERRANSAMQYLASSGVPTQSLNSVSYGKERPLATGHDEASWAKNRRAHFVVKQ